MAWWNRFMNQEKPISREVKTPSVDVKDVSKMKTISLRQLNNRDRDAIKKIEKDLLKAGVLAPREESIEITDRLEDILQTAYDQGLANVQELVGDFELDARLSAGEGGDNLMLDEFDEDEDRVYDIYKDNETSLPEISVETEIESGKVALRLSDGSTFYGEIPGQ